MSDYGAYSDDQLTLLLQQDDQSAFAEIYNRYWKTMFQSTYNVLQVKEPAQDIVQDIFVALWRRRSAAQIESFNPYLQQAVRFQVFKAIRSEKADQEFFKRLGRVTADILEHEPILYKELQHSLKNIINTFIGR